MIKYHERSFGHLLGDGKRLVHIKYINAIKDMYIEVVTSVKIVVGDTKKIPIILGL